MAAKLGLHEQQIQRYEAERYRSISLSNYRRIARLLGVEVTSAIRSINDAWLTSISVPEPTYTDAEVDKVIAHARAQSWFDIPPAPNDQRVALMNYIHGNNIPMEFQALLRTGLSNKHISNDLALIAWKSRCIYRAESELVNLKDTFDPLDISWLRDLVMLSREPDCVRLAQCLMLRKGILLLVEPQIAGVPLDGAAFIVHGTPVVALTLRHDRIDNFWYTLLHEVSHIILHHSRGLLRGFFDDIETETGDEIEIEANDFAAAVLIPAERWQMSPARVSKSPEPIEDLAEQLGIHPAIIFGRIRKERRNYKIFSDKIGQGQIKRQFR